MRNPVRPFSCVTPAGTSNELDVQNKREENTHTHKHQHCVCRVRSTNASTIALSAELATDCVDNRVLKGQPRVALYKVSSGLILCQEHKHVRLSVEFFS